MAITLSLGIGLGYLNNLGQESRKEHFMIQSRIIVDDILRILKNSPELDALMQDTNSSEGFYAFLSQSSFIPLSYEGFEIVLQIESARAKINPNTFLDSNATQNSAKIDALRTYLNRQRVDTAFGDIMLDAMGGVKEDFSYLSDLYYNRPELVRNALEGAKHQAMLNEYFVNKYRYNLPESLNFEELFYYAKQRNTKIDLNFATLQTWMFLLDCDEYRAQTLQEAAGLCTDLECFGLTPEEQTLLARFATSFYEPIVAVTITLRQESMLARIDFEYDLKQKKGSRFVYQI